MLPGALRRPDTLIGHAREVVQLARAAGRWPGGLSHEPVLPTVPSGDPAHDVPVVLVHGFAHNRSAWGALNRELRRAGFTTVHAMNYNPLRQRVPELAARLADHVDRVRAVNGADRVHVVGHSLGGILLRWYVQELGGDETVGAAVTMATPHEGTVVGHAGSLIGGAVDDLRPGSTVMTRLRDGARPSAVRWTAFHSNIDWAVQPAHSAQLTAPALRATNVLVRDRGHISMLASASVARSVVDQLEAYSRADGQLVTLAS